MKLNINMLDYEYPDNVEKNLITKELHPYDRETIKWCLRTSGLLVISIMLLSMPLIAIRQYEIDINDYDTEQPRVLAMANDCLEQYWNVIKNNNSYTVSYYTDDTPESALFLDTNCDANITFPVINFTSNNTCCRFVLWVTL